MKTTLFGSIMPKISISENLLLELVCRMQMPRKKLKKSEKTRLKPRESSSQNWKSSNPLRRPREIKQFPG